MNSPLLFCFEADVCVQNIFNNTRRPGFNAELKEQKTKTGSVNLITMAKVSNYKHHFYCISMMVFAGSSE